jgi:hypothetical protein
MKPNNYLIRKMSATHAEQAAFAQSIANRAREGGDVSTLLEIIDIFPTYFRNNVCSFMKDDGDGYHMLRLRIDLRSMYLAEMSSYGLRDWLSSYSDADDYDDIIDYLERKKGLVRCDDCGEWELSDHARDYYGNEDATICRSCIDNEYQYSDRYDAYIYGEDARSAIDQDGRSCTIHYEDDDFTYDDDEDTYVHEDYDPASRIIGNYHSSKHSQREQPSEWTKLKKRYLGVELEVEVVADRSDRATKAKEIFDHVNDGEFGKRVFFENDGSISHGFEIISQPMGLDKHRELWAWLNDRNLVRHLRSHNTTTCGLHVHVSKQNLSKLQIAKIVTFVNDPDNEQLIRAVARRYAEGYCRIKHKKIGAAAHSEDRYEAVNITSRKTIEFRIFKGSLKYESVMAAIEFSNAVVDFCGRAKTSIVDLKADKFLEFINSDESNETEFLRPYLAQRLEAA